MDKDFKKDIENIIKNINKYTFKATTLENSKTNWNYKGNGLVRVEVKDNKIYFCETLTLHNNNVIEDKKLWEIEEDILKFYHYRHNDYQMIFSFKKTENGYELIEKYHCAPDIYSSTLEVKEKFIIFTIFIKGTIKNEKIEYIYS